MSRAFSFARRSRALSFSTFGAGCGSSAGAAAFSTGASFDDFFIGLAVAACISASGCSSTSVLPVETLLARAVEAASLADDFAVALDAGFAAGALATALEAAPAAFEAASLLFAAGLPTVLLYCPGCRAPRPAPRPCSKCSGLRQPNACPSRSSARASALKPMARLQSGRAVSHARPAPSSSPCRSSSSPLRFRPINRTSSDTPVTLRPPRISRQPSVPDASVGKEPAENPRL